MEINRTKLVDAVHRVIPAVAKKELFEQANKLAFSSGYLVAYNDEISIFEEMPEVEEISGAVDGRRFYELLSKVSAPIVDLTQGDDNKLSVRAGRVKASFDMVPVSLPIDEIDRTGEAEDLPADFEKSLALISGCCAREMSRPVLACVRMDGHSMEAADGYRMARMNFDLFDLPKALLPVTAAEVVADYPIRTAAVGDAGEWMRFAANEGRTVIYARLSSGAYPDLSAIYEMDGHQLVLPEKLFEMLNRARIFSKREHRIDEEVKIELRPTRITVKATCDGAQFSEGVGWDGSTTAEFSIHPDFLSVALKSGTACIVGDTKIKFIGEGWDHVISLR